MSSASCSLVVRNAPLLTLRIDSVRTIQKKAWKTRRARQARLVDGADEVHKMVLNRNLDAEETGFWAWDVQE